MKVLLVHNAYQHRGGEDAVVEAEADLLRARGVSVSTHIANNDALSGMSAKLRAAANVEHNASAIAPVIDLARRENPDVIHVHNFFPVLSPGLHLELASRGFPIVQTLHNYRLLCANAMFMRENEVCEKCLTGTRLNAVRHRCYRDSAIGSATVLRFQNASIGSARWLQSISRFVALTAFQREKLVQGGLPPEKTAIKGNFVPHLGAGAAWADRAGALFVGRIAPGKGVDLLARAWRHLPDVPLTIVGDGPDLEAVRAMAPPHVAFRGRLDKEAVMKLMAQAKFLIVPSTWYEGFPMTIVEAFASGLPVLGSNLGGVAEIVRPGANGMLFEPGDPGAIERSVRDAFEDHEAGAQMSRHAQADYARLYSEDANFLAITKIYKDAIKEKKQTA